MYRNYISHPYSVWRNTRQLFSPILPSTILFKSSGTVMLATPNTTQTVQYCWCICEPMYRGPSRGPCIRSIFPTLLAFGGIQGNYSLQYGIVSLGLPLPLCRYPRTGVPSLAVSRQGLYNYPWLRLNSRTPVVRSPDSLDNGPGPVSRLGKIRERRVSRERRALSPNSRGSGPPVEPGPPRKSRTPDGVPDHLYSNRTPRKGEKSTPCLGVVRSRHVSTSTDTYTRPLGLHIRPHHHCIHCGRWTSTLM